MGNRAQAVIEKHVGAAQRTFQILEPFLKKAEL